MENKSQITPWAHQLEFCVICCASVYYKYILLYWLHNKLVEHKQQIKHAVEFVHVCQSNFNRLLIRNKMLELDAWDKAKVEPHIRQSSKAWIIIEGKKVLKSEF